MRYHSKQTSRTKMLISCWELMCSWTSQWGQMITCWADLTSFLCDSFCCVCVHQWGTPVRTGMEDAPSCVVQKAAWFTAAADLVSHWLEMAGSVKVRNWMKFESSYVTMWENDIYHYASQSHTDPTLRCRVQTEAENYSLSDMTQSSCWTVFATLFWQL